MDDQNKTIYARWCVDSETSIRYLIDLRTNKVLMIGTPEETMNQNDELSPIVHSADYSLGFEDGYEECENELEPIISEMGEERDELVQEIDDLTRHILDLKQQIYTLGGTVQ